MNCSIPGFPILHYLLELALTHVHWVDDVIHPSHPLLPPSPPTFIFPSIKVFSSESDLWIRGPNYWSFSFSTSTSNEYSRLISFWIDWFDLLSVQGTLKSLLHHHSLIAYSHVNSIRTSRRIHTGVMLIQSKASLLLCQVLYTKGGQVNAYTEGVHQDRDWNDRSTCQGMSKRCWCHHKLGRGKEGFFPKDFRATTALLLSWFRTSGL